MIEEKDEDVRLDQQVLLSVLGEFPSESQISILYELANEEGQTGGELADSTGLDSDTIWRQTERLADEGLFYSEKREDHGAGPQPAEWYTVVDYTENV